MIGLTWAFLPLLILISGFLCKLSVVDPYPVPDSYKYASIISPVITGLNENVPVVPPNETLASTLISGYWNI